ncbi:MAG TPA: PASTA domain-containing protein [Candidatus Kapabacteria bacterium]|nr:PASTA domain-containing protein [Candidatus Kapabacteria bacterium]
MISLKQLKNPQLRFRKFLVSVLIVVLGFFALLLVLDKIVLPWYVKRGEVSVLPKVVGMNVDDALSTLEKSGYEPIKYETRFDEKFKEGTIIRQTPEGGDETKPGRKVYLIISGGKQMVVMPELTGKNIRDARLILVKANLDVGKTDMAFTDSIPAGVVFKQTPRPGTTVTTSEKIDLVVSQGPRAGRVAVPDLTSLTVSEAILRLGAVKLGKGYETPIDKPDGRPGTISDQAPKPGELVLEGTMVDVFVVKEVVKPPEEH